jgi:hypothetical protein
MTSLLYWPGCSSADALLGIAETAFALADAVAPNEVKRLRHR